MKIINRHALFRWLRLLGSRESIVLLLLACFLNTILFPAICYPTHYYKKIDFSQTKTKSSATNYLDLDTPVPENPEEDAKDVFSATEDIDLIAHFNATTFAAPDTLVDLTFAVSDSCVIHTFLSNSTPPPEYSV